MTFRPLDDAVCGLERSSSSTLMTPNPIFDFHNAALRTATAERKIRILQLQHRLNELFLSYPELLRTSFERSNACFTEITITELKWI